MRLAVENVSEILLQSNILNFLFCLTILIYIRYILQAKTDSTTLIALKRLVLCAVVCLVADMFSYLFDSQTGEFAKIMNHISMFFSITLTAFVGYLWNGFFDLLFHIRRERKQYLLLHALWLIPTVLLVGLLLANCFYGFIFNIDEENVYHRGGFYFISFLLQYISFATCIIRAMLFKVQTEDCSVRTGRMRRTAIFVGVIVVFFGAVQWITNGKIAVHCMGLTAGIIIMFVRFLDNQITRDRLTDLNNRYALDTHIAEKLRSYQAHYRPTKLIFILMDVNDFKAINDVYGHLEGDEALKCLAEALRTVEHKNPKYLFVARYGGDEFAAVLEARDESAVASFSHELSRALDKTTANRPYRISFSLGYSVYDEFNHVTRWIEKADAELYKNKKRK